MSAPHRIRKSVYIMVPGKDVVRNRGLFMVGVRASRLADQMHYMPLFPQLTYATILTEEELDREMPKRCQLVLRRSSAIWLCLYPDATFDVVSYRILMDNEGYLNGSRRQFWRPSRLPVWAVEEKPKDAGLSVRLLGRDELSDVLRCNVVDGLLQGVGAAAVG